MKLFVKRDQESGMLGFGGISFCVTARVELAPEEMDLVKKYKAHKSVLFTTKHAIFGEVNYKIEDMIGGIKTKCKDISEILQSEEIVKEACRNFDIMIKVMANFGGEEVIDFSK